MKIRVEPGIFEWTKWEAGRTTPTLMTAEELKEANVNVSTDYRCATQPCPLPGFSWKTEGSLTQGGSTAVGFAGGEGDGAHSKYDEDSWGCVAEGAGCRVGGRKIPQSGVILAKLTQRDSG